MPLQVRIIVDERERQSGVPELLAKFGGKIEYRFLSVGDYVLSSECAVERKDAHDFVNSLFSGRLFDQAYRLSEAYRFSMLIVEGDLLKLVEESSKPRAFWGALATIAFGYGLHVFFTRNTAQTADFIYTIAKHGRFVRPGRPLIQKKPKVETLQESQLLVVASLPGVGPRFADKLLRHFGSVRQVFSSSLSQLALVEGFGRSRAENVVRLLDASYQPSEKLASQARLDQ
ncbi:MAG: ERCC4 domain-containing protein [Candidatus Bathyarchaeia archaeon]